MNLPRIRPCGRILKRICCAHSFTYMSCPIAYTKKKNSHEGCSGSKTCRGYVLAVVSSKEYAAHILSRTSLALSRRPTKKDNLWLSFSVGTGNRGRTCTVTHRILNPARLPIPPYPRGITIIVYHKSGEMSIIIYPDFVWIRGMSDPRRQRQLRLS